MPSAIDADGLSGDEVAVEKGQGGFRNLPFATPPTKWRCPFHGFRFIVSRVRWSDDRPRGDRVHEDVIGGHFQCERFGERHHTGFGDVVRQEAWIAWPSAPRKPVAEVDDAAAALLAHVRDGRLRAEK